MIMSALAMFLAASPTIVRVDMQDALRLPSGFETPPGNPLIILIKAPPTWVAKNAITTTGKDAVLARLYGGPDWMKGNVDGSTYVVKSFQSKVIDAKALPAGAPSVFWYEVDAKGALQKRGPGFSDPTPPPEPKSLIDSAIPGSVYEMGPKLSDAKAALAFLAKHEGQVKLPTILKRGDVGFAKSGATAGALSFRADDTKLGISLDDQARQACGEQKTCTLWLFGHWAKGSKEHVFSVTSVETVSAREASMPERLGAIWVQKR
ncbi:MAG: hypothetical protein Q8N26_02310 [Myxococcales bacterium]|nr:hypothetical protein [Myxococcales bacterium]